MEHLSALGGRGFKSRPKGSVESFKGHVILTVKNPELTESTKLKSLQLSLHLKTEGHTEIFSKKANVNEKIIEKVTLDLPFFLSFHLNDEKGHPVVETVPLQISSPKKLEQQTVDWKKKQGTLSFSLEFIPAKDSSPRTFATQAVSVELWVKGGKAREKFLLYVDGDTKHKQTIKFHETHLEVEFTVKEEGKRATKKQQSKSVFIPWALCWAVQLEQKNFVKILSPEHKLRIDVGEESSFFTKMTDHILTACALNKINPLKRAATFQYAHGGCTYKGEWKDGKPHGEGQFYRKDVCGDPAKYESGTFTGTWNADLCAGYGELVNKFNTIRTDVGWVYTEDVNFLYIPKHYDCDEQLEASGFYPSDIKTIFSKSDPIRTFKRGDLILKEGATNDKLHYLKEGTLKVFKSVDGVDIELTTLQPGSFLGELSILDKQQITATVQVSSELCIMWIVEKQLLLRTLADHPDLCLRYYKYIGKTLAEKIRAHNPKQQLSPEARQKALDTWRDASKKAVAAANLIHAFHSVPTPQNHWEAKIFKFMSAWNTGNINDVMDFFLPGAWMKDPFNPIGVDGIVEVKQQIANSLEKNLIFYEPRLFQITTEQGERVKYIIRSRFTLPSHSKVAVMVFVCFELDGDKFNEIELCYDREALASPSLEIDDTDYQFRKMFGLEGYERKIFEVECEQTKAKGGPTTPGVLYLSTRHLCFRCVVFGFDSKFSIPIEQIEEMNPSTENSITFSLVEDNTENTFELIFPSSGIQTDIQCKIQGLMDAASKTQPSTPAGTRTLAAGNKSLIQAYISSNADRIRALPDKPIKPVAIDKCLRIIGPSSSPDPRSRDRPVKFQNCSAGLSISNYPCMTRAQPGGKPPKKEDYKLGDPICDQFVVDQFTNQTLFAIADGCGWGSKARKAAFNASRMFLDYTRKKQVGFLTVPQITRVCLEAFHYAQEKILDENREEPKYVGTTTMIGGAIVELDTRSESAPRWGLVAVGLGDCKAYHFKFSEGLDGKTVSIDEITVGSRNETNITDASDPGGRLGAQLPGGKPDLRNFDFWFREVNEDDLIMLCSDGVHDNLDPQITGKKATDFPEIKSDDWSKADPTLVVKVKTDYAHNQLHNIFMKHYTANDGKINLSELTTRVVEHCKDTCSKLINFMEENPNAKQPNDYSKFPGKCDHCTCVFLKVGKSPPLSKQEKPLDIHVLRMRNQADPFNSGDTEKFSGKSLVEWFVREKWHDNPAKSYKAELLAQKLLNFKYIKKVSPATGFGWTFDVDHQYAFQVHPPIMSPGDWELLRTIFKPRRYSKKEVIIEQDVESTAMFQIIKGECSVILLKPDPANPSKPTQVKLATMKAPDVFGELNFLEKKKSTARVVAKRDCELYEIKEQELRIMFAKHPALVAKFYHYLATIVANRLQAVQSR